MEKKKERKEERKKRRRDKSKVNRFNVYTNANTHHPRFFHLRSSATSRKVGAG